MKQNQIKPACGATKKKHRVGRGNASGWGGEAGRGHKGQKSRSGYKSKPGFEGGQTPLYRRLPKKNGFRSLNRQVYAIINFNKINEIAENTSEITLEMLLDHVNGPKTSPVKVLATGKLEKVLTIYAHEFSKTAKAEIEKLGGCAKVIK